MSANHVDNFFDSKRPWSKYKDLVLDYYLTPYLEKVKRLGKPLLLVDMYAGRGDFESGEPGSPLIIAKHLDELKTRNVQVKLLCLEEHDKHCSHLATMLQQRQYAEVVHENCLTQVDRIARDATNHTVFLYVDPCKATGLHLEKLARIYERVRGSSSVEVLLVFMASSFMREACRVVKEGNLLHTDGPLADPLIAEAECREDKEMWLGAAYSGEETSAVKGYWKSEDELNAIAGGDYWRMIAENRVTDWTETCAQFVDQYCGKMRTWFDLVESYPIHADRGQSTPKYWLVFGSRYLPAIDLFNRACCNAGRKQRSNYAQPGTLFEGIPPSVECAAEGTVDREVLRCAAPPPGIQWREFRWRVCSGRAIGNFTDTEINKSIKRLLQSGRLVGAEGKKIEEDKPIYLPSSQPA